jgi:hypothetical protein
MATAAHVLYPIMPLKIESLRMPNAMVVTVLGAEDLDMNEIDLSSLKFHGAAPLNVTISDTNGDGRPDLIAVFDELSMKRPSNGMSATLTGWLKNSRAFVGTGELTITP